MVLLCKKVQVAMYCAQMKLPPFTTSKRQLSQLEVDFVSFHQFEYMLTSNWSFKVLP